MSFHRFRRPEQDLLHARDHMIAETSAFLSWALKHPDQMPRIPRRRVAAGGYTALLRQPGARAAVTQWWHRALSALATIGR